MLRLRSLGITGADCASIHPEAARLTTDQCAEAGGTVTDDGQFCQYPSTGVCSLIVGYSPLAERGAQGPSRQVGPGVSYDQYSQAPQQYYQQNPYQPIYQQGAYNPNYTGPGVPGATAPTQYAQPGQPGYVPPAMNQPRPGGPSQASMAPTSILGLSPTTLLLLGGGLLAVVIYAQKARA